MQTHLRKLPIHTICKGKLWSREFANLELYPSSTITNAIEKYTFTGPRISIRKMLIISLGVCCDFGIMIIRIETKVPHHFTSQLSNANLIFVFF